MQHPTANNAFLYGVVFTGGMTTLAVELTASRLLGSVFGTSNLVWANVIGLMLLYLTVGYFLGGRLADRRPHHSFLYQILIWAAFLSALIPLLSRPVLQTAARAFADYEAALALGSFVAVLVLFSIPVTLLGTVSPFAIRLAVKDVQNAGRISGQIYAIGTIGSIVGTFLPVLFIIPELGTTRTFLFFAAILYLVAFAGLWQHSRRRALVSLWMPTAIALLASAVLPGYLRPPASGKTVLFEAESAYNYIQVVEDDAGFRYLYLNEGTGIHSQWHPEQIIYRRTWDLFLAAPYFTPDFQYQDMESILIIGLAGGTIARQHIEVYGDVPIDGIEIDPIIIEAGARFFDMNAIEMPNLRTYAADGRYGLNQLDRTYTVIGVDAYRPPYIPWHMTTIEFFQEIQQKLTPDGVLVINVGRTSEDRRLVDALSATIGQLFPTLHAIDVPASFNTILVATQQSSTQDDLQRNLQKLPVDASPVLRDTLQLALDHIVPVTPSDLIFTDDRAPVETLTDSIVLNFLLGGGVEELR